MCMKVKMIHHDFYHPYVKDSNIDYGDCTLLFNKYKLQSNAHFSRSWQANCTAQELNFFFVPWRLKNEGRRKVWKSGGASSKCSWKSTPFPPQIEIGLTDLPQI